MVDLFADEFVRLVVLSHSKMGSALLHSSYLPHALRECGRANSLKSGKTASMQKSTAETTTKSPISACFVKSEFGSIGVDGLFFKSRLPSTAFLPKKSVDLDAAILAHARFGNYIPRATRDKRFACMPTISDVPNASVMIVGWSCSPPGNTNFETTRATSIEVVVSILRHRTQAPSSCRCGRCNTPLHRAGPHSKDHPQHHIWMLRF